jgi:hypothetical protein
MKRRKSTQKNCYNINPLPIQLPTHPFRMLIHGRSGQGKSTLWIKIFKNYYSKFFDRIIMFCPNYYYDPKYNYVDNSKVILYDEATPTNLIAAWNTIRCTPQYSTLLWFDDCMGQPGMRCKELTQILINIRHNNTSCVALVQEITGISPVFRRQCECFISFQTQDEDDRNMVVKNFGMGNKKDFLKFYDFCTTEKRHFMLMNRQGAQIKYYHNFTPVDTTSFAYNNYNGNQ